MKKTQNYGIGHSHGRKGLLGSTLRAMVDGKSQRKTLITVHKPDYRRSSMSKWEENIAINLARLKTAQRERML